MGAYIIVSTLILLFVLPARLLSDRIDPDCQESDLHKAIIDGRVELAEELISNGSDIYALDCKDRTPMHMAVLSQQDSMVLVLLRAGFDVNRKFKGGRTVLFDAVVTVNRSPLIKLLESGAIVDTIDDQGSTPVYEAVRFFVNDKPAMNVTLNTLIEFKADLSLKLPGGLTYLHKAAEDESFDAVDFFATSGTPVDALDDKGETPLGISVRRDNAALVNLLIYKGADKKLFNTLNETYAHIAAEKNSTQALLALLENGVEVDPVDSKDETPLTIAVKQDNSLIIGILSDFKAGLERLSVENDTYVHIASRFRCVSALKTLLTRGALVDPVNNLDQTPLAIAVENDEPEIMDILLKNKADIGRLSKKEDSYLHIASSHQSIHAMKDLLQRGISVDSINDADKTPLSIAVEKDSRELISLLLSSNASVRILSNSSESYLHIAARYNSKEAFLTFVQQGLPVDAVSSTDETPMTIAVQNDCIEIINILLQNSADTYRLSKQSETYLHVAARHNSTKALRRFLERGLPVDSVSNNDETPLTIAVEENCLENVNLLLSYKADVNILTKTKDTFLHIAAKFKSYEVVEVLLEKGVPVDSLNSESNTALAIAATNAKGDIVSMLAEYKADLTLKFSSDQTYMHIAAGCPDCIKVLVEYCLDVNPKDSNGNTPILLAVTKDSSGAAAVLADSGADLQQTSPDAKTLLHSAAEACAVESIRWLATKGLNVNATDSAQRLPLHYAASKDSGLTAVQVLVSELHSCIDCKDNQNKSSLTIAQESKHDDIVAYLKSQGATE